MIQNLPAECTMVSDTDSGDEAPEQSIIVGDYEGSGSVCLIAWDGHEVNIPYRMVKEITKVMNQYANATKKKK
jgi:hypothetical protein